MFGILDQLPDLTSDGIFIFQDLLSGQYSHFLS
jgi:hypothetical protein